MPEQLTLSLGEAPVSHSPSQEDEKAWTESLLCVSNTGELLEIFARAGFCGRTSPEYFQRETTPSGSSLMRWKNSGMAWRGERLTLNSSEWHNDADVCFLSEVLEGGAQLQRYFLSSKACAGILRRARTRGKNLPPVVERALESVVGGGLGFVQNQRNEIRTMEVSGALAARPGVKQQTYVLGSTQAHAELCENLAPTQVARQHKDPPVVCMADDNVNASVDEDLAGTLKCGGGQSVASNGRDYVGALTARDYKGVGNEYVQEGKVICQRC